MLQVQIQPLAVSAPSVTADTKVRILDARETLPRKAVLQMETPSTPEPPATPPTAEQVKPVS